MQAQDPKSQENMQNTFELICLSVMCKSKMSHTGLQPSLAHAL